jgi:hypothetical protein
LACNAGWVGTRTMIGRWPDEKLTIVVLSNHDYAEVEKIVDRIAKMIFAENGKRPGD